MLTPSCSVRRQYELSRPIYEKRQRLVSQIQNFWPLVMEQAPPDIDEYIQPSDSALLLSSLTSLSVSRFEVDEGGSDGDPRSFAIRLEFAPNDYFEDTVLEKRFWYRHSPRESWSGLVSEPVDIRWKKGKDLTGGLLSLVKKSWEQEKAEAAAGGQRSKKNGAGLTPEQVALKNKIDATGLGGLSFFAWFGFRGKHITAEESRIAVEREREKRRLRAAAAAAAAETDGATSTTATTAVAVSTTLSNSEGELLSAPVDEDDDVDDMDLEIFPGGDDLALTIAEDLWPNAIKYFSKFVSGRVGRGKTKADRAYSPSPRTGTR